jgi:selenocysteine-specific elongation factor
MQVIATAGHVDHGKSALVRALTGMETDRWAEERRRGMTIDLGFAWTTLPSGADLALVDVPGHERFVTNMLAGVGPVPAVCLVVAADEGWQPQTEEHVRALEALGVSHGLLVVTKSDLAEPADALAQARARLADRALRHVEAVAVSAHTGEGMPELVAALDGLVAGMPPPSRDGPVRLWIDRAFTVGGAGTVVTGTLPAGSISVGDGLEIAAADRPRSAVVRGLQAHRSRRECVTAVDRVAVNLRGVGRDEVARGMALVTPGAWTTTADLDVDVDGDIAREVVVHVGSAAVPGRRRPLAGGVSRLRLSAALPLHVGDRLILREPGSRRVVGATVLDVAAPVLRRRGDGAERATTLRWPRSVDDEVSRLGFARRSTLVAAGFTALPRDSVVIGDHVLSAAWIRRQAVAATGLVDAAGAHGVAAAALCEQTGIPADTLPAILDAAGGLEHQAGRVTRSDVAAGLSAPMQALLDRLQAEPWSGPDVRGLDPAELSSAVRQGRLVRLGSGIYVGSAAAQHAAAVLAGLAQPFTVSEARQALGSTRRVVVPLLEHLDAARRTRRNADGTRVVVRPEA